MAPRRNAKPSAEQLKEMRRAAGTAEAKRLGIASDDAPALVETIEEGAKRPRNTAKRNRSESPRSNPNYEDPTPLSDVIKSHLSDLGIHGLSTHGEALKHLHQTANVFGFTPGATKRTSTGALGELASHVASVTGTKDPLIAGREADIIDQASVLHEGLTAMLQPYKYPQQSAEPGSVRTGRNPRTRPQIETQSLDEIPVDRPKNTPTTTTSAPPVSRKPEAHGKMLRNLPAVPKPDTSSMGPRKAKKAMSEYEAKVAAQLATAPPLNTASRSGALALGHSESRAGKMWSFDPDDGGWAHRTIDPPVGSVNTPEPSTPAPDNKRTGRKNAPIKLTDMVGTMLNAERDILEARAKFPEQDNPMPGFR